MKWFWKRKIKLGCKFGDSCDCKTEKKLSCYNCQYYWFIDSGYGYCKAIPIPVVVGWCKDICSLFKKK